MPRRYRPVIILLAALILLSSADVFAKKRKGKYDNDKIISVDVAANKIVVTEGKDDAAVTYTVNKFTVVTLNGSPAKLADLKKGMKVDVSVGGSGNVASKIDAQGKGSSKKN